MTTAPDAMIEMHKRFDALQAQYDQMREMMVAQAARNTFRNTELAEVKGVVFAEAARSAFRNTTIATLQSDVGELAETMRLKDRKRLTVAEAARRADVEPATVRKWLESGELKGTKTGNKKQSQWRIGARDLERFLDRNVNQTTKPEQENA